jgi:arsenate reductase (thioredoxin)
MAIPLHVLFLCTGNSARSILAEALINHSTIGGGKFRGFSAGSHPKGEVHPLALETLRQNRLPTDGLRSKSWSEFAAPDAPTLDFVFTVCDNSAAELCPTWPGQPMTAHWGIPDPASVQGTDAERLRAFREAFLMLRRRIELFACLPLDKLKGLSLQERLNQIGQTGATQHTGHPADRGSPVE